jgi:hypothetical protein
MESILNEKSNIIEKWLYYLKVIVTIELVLQLKVE